jgi:hypothetical protein
MALTIYEKADELQFELRGIFSDAEVIHLQDEWERAQLNGFWRQIVVDISELSRCDTAGEQLLSRLLALGNRFSARNPYSLQLLRRLSERASGGSAPEDFGSPEKKDVGLVSPAIGSCMPWLEPNVNLVFLDPHRVVGLPNAMIVSGDRQYLLVRGIRVGRAMTACGC